MKFCPVSVLKRLLVLSLLGLPASVHADVDVVELVTRSIDQTRGKYSYAEMSMVISRPDWQRSSSLVAWTRGREDALIRFTAPARDAGNALLKQGEKMWTFNPKLNRNIRLPNSMMSQSWAGSDFSYNDLSRSDKWLRHYDLTLAANVEADGHQIYTIDAIPKDDAPVVWGKEQMVIRDDFVLMELTYFDQELVPVKQMKSLTIANLGGRVMATKMRMLEFDTPDEYTELSYEAMDFDVELEDRMFTVFALQSGRDR
ncbi:MAG: outer membrane lipoprotein-sorting protein [Pseudomonadales bacterium]|nr:outer membrane lipoprotein-sorting protein [Pseudomonadales bacterium]